MAYRPLYIVTHAKLSPGYQTAQVAHAVAHFAKSRPRAFRSWMGGCEVIVVLEELSAKRLRKLYRRASRKGFDTVAFMEPDVGYGMTALAFTPSKRVRKFLRKLPLSGTAISMT